MVSTPTHLTAPIPIDLNGMRGIINLAVRRVSAFVRFGLDDLNERSGGDFSLASGFDYQFWPKDISDDNRQAAREEYRAWLVGSCLRELDLFYGLFLDKLWFAIEAAHLHGTSIRSDYVFDKKFARITNVAVKQKQVAAKLGISDYFVELNSLSLARNALSHHAGVVRTPVDCNSDNRDRLVIKWLAFDILASRDGDVAVIDQMPFDTHNLSGDGDIHISLLFSERKIEVPAGHQIKLSNKQIAELCMFYKILCDKIIDGYSSFLANRGIYLGVPNKSEAIS